MCALISAVEVSCAFYTIPIDKLYNNVILLLFQVDSKYDAGLYEEAKKASRTALILNIIGMVVGSVLTIIFTAIIIGALASS